MSTAEVVRLHADGCVCHGCLLETFRDAAREAMRDELRTILGPPIPVLLNREQTAELLHCSTKHLDRLVEAGELRPIRSGTLWRLRLDDYLDYLDRCPPWSES